jgi:hypothetical protein
VTVITDDNECFSEASVSVWSATPASFFRSIGRQKMIKNTYRHSGMRGDCAANIVGYRKNKSNLNDIDGVPGSSLSTDRRILGVERRSLFVSYVKDAM